MVVRALRGALGFFSVLPVGHDERDWDAFRHRPAVLPLTGSLLGAFLTLPLLVLSPVPTAVAGFVVWLYLLTGIAHADAVTDFGDALAVHGSPERKRDAMTDSAVGVGGVLLLSLVILSLALAALWLASVVAAGQELAVLAVIVGSEVGAKTAIAVVACLGEATHEGLGSSLTDPTDRRSLPLVSLAAAPVLALGVVTLAAPVATLAAVLTGVVVLRVARSALGGVSGDVLGATNELGRVVALHAGVIAWTHL